MHFSEKIFGECLQVTFVENLSDMPKKERRNEETESYTD